MKRKRRDIFEEMMRLFDEMIRESFYGGGRFLPGPEEYFPARYEPYTDMVETDKEVIFTAEIPGIRKEDIKINATENSIDIEIESMEKEERKEKEGYEYYSRYQGFKSSYSTPTKIDPNKVRARYKNGILEIRAPKMEVKEKKKIRVE